MENRHESSPRKYTAMNSLAAGLLTCASATSGAFPGLISQWLALRPCSQSQRLQLRGSGGISPRFPNTARVEFDIQASNGMRQIFHRSWRMGLELDAPLMLRRCKNKLLKS